MIGREGVDVIGGERGRRDWGEGVDVIGVGHYNYFNFNDIHRKSALLENASCDCACVTCLPHLYMLCTLTLVPANPVTCQSCTEPSMTCDTQLWCLNRFHECYGC